jgi:hypothetical protein
MSENLDISLTFSPFLPQCCYGFIGRNKKKKKGVCTSLLVTSIPAAESLEITFNRSYGYINKFTESPLPSAWMRPTPWEGDLGSTAGEATDTKDSFAERERESSGKL